MKSVREHITVEICIATADGNHFLSFFFVVFASLRITNHCANHEQYRPGADSSVVQALNLLADACVKQVNYLVPFIFT